MTGWTASDIPPQQGRVAVVTGTGGLGYETAYALVKAGAEVILAGRDLAKGAAAIERIASHVPDAAIRFERLDLASLASIADFGRRLARERDSLDLLVNNAGVMVPPQHIVTADGFELQMGTNYLGHFALTGHLMPLLRKGQATRIISVSSVAARGGAIDFDNLQGQQTYRPMVAYSQSKLACLMFALELQHRSWTHGWNVTSIAAHPGVSRTGLLHNGPGRWSVPGLARSVLPFLFQPAAQGALPLLFAATSPQAKGGAYYGPNRMGETRGQPALAKVPPQALDEASVAHLWDISEALTSVSYEPEAVDDVGLLSLAENSPGSVARSRHIPPIPMVQENDNVQ